MGQIDLKYATLFVEDGSVSTGAVNLTAGYTVGAVTMLMDTHTGIVPVGMTFTIAGESGSPTHTVTAHTETSTNTTSITFTPAVAGTVADNTVLTFGPNVLELHIGEGNLEWTEKRAITYVKDRGKLAYTRLGDEEPTDISFEFIWDFLVSDASGGEPVTMKEALTNTGAAATWLSSAEDPCQPYAVNIRILYTPPCAGVKSELMIIRDFRWEELQHSTKDAKVSAKGKSNFFAVESSRVD